MKTLKEIKPGTLLACTYDKGENIDHFLVIKQTNEGTKVYNYTYNEVQTINLNLVINAGFAQSNYFTRDNKPELFKRFF